MILAFAFFNDPTTEIVEIKPLSEANLSTDEGSLVFINSKLYNSDDFDFVLLKNDTIVKFQPEINKHIIFENSNFSIKSKQKNQTLSIFFWRIADGLCDQNAYVLSTDYQMSFVPRSTKYSKFCLFSSTNVTDYSISMHATRYKNQNNFDLYSDGSNGPYSIANDVSVRVSRPFLMIGKKENLNIGKILFQFSGSNNNCSIYPIYKIDRYLSNEVILPKNWIRLDLKCISQGNDSDIGFIVLVTLFIVSVFFVLINANKFVTFDRNELIPISEPLNNPNDRLVINEDLSEMSSNSDHDSNNQIEPLLHQNED